jgi:hypothetical protein
MLLRSFCIVVSLTVALSAQSSRSNPPAAPGGAMPRPAQQQVDVLLRATRNLDAVAFWDWLPTGYQSDIEGLAHDLAERIDAKSYDRAAKLLQRFATVAIEKQQFVFGSETVGRMLHQSETDVDGTREAYTSFFRMLRQVASGELGSVDGLRRFDGRTFARRSGKALLETLFAFARAKGNDPMRGLDQVRVRTVGQRGDEVKVEVTSPDRDTEVTSFVQVEGRWVPVDMARKWQQGVGELRQKIAAMPKGGDAKVAAQLGLALGMMESFVRKFEDCESQRDFDEVLAEMMALSQGGNARRR